MRANLGQESREGSHQCLLINGIGQKVTRGQRCKPAQGLSKGGPGQLHSGSPTQGPGAETHLTSLASQAKLRTSLSLYLLVCKIGIRLLLRVPVG